MEEETVIVIVYDENAEDSFDWNEMDIEEYVAQSALIDENFEEDY